jgi:hypothetical protein
MRRTFPGLLSYICFASLLQGQAAPDAASLDSTLKQVKWRSIGPFRGGRSVAASGVVGNDKVYYMGTTGGGLWKTENAGITWKNISDGFFKTGTIGAIAVAESDPNVVYVGSGVHRRRKNLEADGTGLHASHLTHCRSPEEPGHPAGRGPGRPVRA